MKILLACFSLLYFNVSFAQEGGGFSSEILKQLGLDSSVIEQIKSGYVPEGPNFMIVYVNGDKIGVTELDFVNKNNFYINKLFTEKINLKDELLDSKKALFLDLYPESKIIYENAELNLFIPAYYFKEDEKEKQKGRGGFLNYRFDYDKELTNEDEDQVKDVLSTDFTYGLNFDGYLFRGTANYNSIEKEVDFNYNFIQKNFIERKTLGRVGDIFTLNPYHGSVDIVGVQYASDSYFLNSSTVRVEGNVKVQTRVEVYISDSILIYRKTVPSGYYEFTDIKLPFSANKLRILERGSDGNYNEREVLVQQTEFNFQDDAEFGLTIGYANNKVTDIVENDFDTGIDNEYKDWVVSGYSDIFKSGNKRLLGSLLVGDDYYFTGFGYTQNFEESPFYLSSFNLESGASYSNEEYGDGYYASSSINFNSKSNYGLNIFSRFESENFKQLENDPSSFKQQISSSVYTPAPYFDNMSISYNKTYYYNDSPSDSVNITLQKYYSNDSYFNVESYYDNNDEWSVSLFFSMPIGFTNKVNYIDLGYLRDRREQQYELSANGKIDGYEYNVSSSHYVEEDLSTMSVNVDKNFDNVYVSAGTYMTDQGLENAYGSIEGGLAFSSKGYYDFTSENIDSTFAFIKVDDLDGISIKTSGSNVVTSGGVAVIPSLNPYMNNSVEIETKTLPENTSVENGYKEIYLSYGSIGEIIINTQPFYQSLIKLVDEDGNPLTRNNVIVNMQDEFITMVGFDGLVFFEVETNNKLFKAKSKLTECRFDIREFEEIDGDSNVKSIVCK